MGPILFNKRAGKDCQGCNSPNESIMKQTKITVKQENKGKRGILDLTGQLSQVLKQFEGIYTRKLPETDGLTVEDWMEAHGVPRFVTPKGVKKGYTPALINGGWREEMLAVNDSNKVMGNYIFKNVPAKYVMDEDDKETAYRVYASEEEALKADGKPISVYRLALIDPHKWSVNTILTGLIQSRKYTKLAEKSKEAEDKWAAIEHCYIVKTEGSERKVIEVSKDRVEF